MPKKGDDHLRRSHIEKAKSILRELSGSPRPKARERDQLVAEAINRSAKHAKGIRQDAERELQAEGAGSGGGCRYLDDLADLADRVERLFSESVEARQLNAASAALKQLFTIRQEQALWRGERPPEPDDDQGGDVHLHLHLDAEDGA